MKKILKRKLTCIFGILAVFFSVNLSSNAAYCNSPCPNPCSPSRTICEGTNCTTYCDTKNAVYYSTPSVSFSYSTPNVSFSISNEYIGYDVLRIHHPVVHRSHSVVHYAKPPKPMHNARPVPNRPMAHKPPKAR